MMHPAPPAFASSPSVLPPLHTGTASSGCARTLLGSCSRDVSVGMGSPLLRDLIANPHEALDLKLPLWTKIFGLVATNVLGIQVGQAV